MKTFAIQIISFMILFASTSLFAGEDLHKAIQDGNLERVKALLKEGHDEYHIDRQTGQNPLHEAISQGNMDIAEVLIRTADNKKRYIYTFNTKGETPLRIAAKKGDTAMVELLVRYGADVDELDFSNFLQGYYPRGANVDFSRFSPLKEACFLGKKAMALSLIRNHANVNAADTLGSTPLHIAVQYDHTDIVELLIQNGANIHLANRLGETPLALAKTPELRAKMEQWEKEYLSKKTAECLDQQNYLLNNINDIVVEYTTGHNLKGVRFTNPCTPITKTCQNLNRQ